MTRDELLSFAQQAGIEVHYRKQQARIGIDELTGQDSTGKLERFAALVAAAEREACAKDAEAFHHHGYDFTGNLELHEWLRARPTGHKES